MSNVLDINDCIVVLNDGETYSAQHGSHVCFLSAEGIEQLDINGEVDDIEHKNVLKTVTLSELLECWLRNTQNT
jgi:hypothetical protein